MGWLRELMAEATPPVRSFGALARAALADAEWPADCQPQPRSLEALLGKLDREQDLGWLEERPAVRRALARTLSCAVEDLDRARPRQRDGRETAELSERRVRLHALRFGRVLDLRDEALFPGLPPEVLQPAGWGRLWWVAPPGSGASLAGRWLALRGLAEPVHARSSRDATANTARRSPTFLRLDQDDGGEVRTPAPVCVAAPFAPRQGGFAVVTSPPLSAVLTELLGWVESRLSPESGFDVERARDWFERVALSSGAAVTVGDALGLCGALDEVGFRTAVKESLPALVRRFVARRVAALTEIGHEDAGWLLRSAAEVLAGLAVRLLTDTDRAWYEPRTLETWLTLVPEEFQRALDVEWMRATLVGPRGPVRSRDLDRAARRLPPGAFRVVRGLEAAGLLVREDTGSDLALRPRWLGRALVRGAEQRLAAGAPLEYAAALLAPHGAEGVAEALLARVRAEHVGLIDDVLELDPDAGLGEAVAVETVARVTGLALLEGTEVPHDLVEALADEQLRLLVVLEDGLPRPRVPHRAPPGSLLSEPVYWLSSLALAEAAGGARSRRSPLRPWGASAPPAGLVAVFDGVAAELPATAAPRALATFALIDRLRRVIGQVTEPCHALELPGVALDEIALGVASWETLARLVDLPHGVAALEALAERRGMRREELAREIWRAFLAAHIALADAPLLDGASGTGAWLWGAAPPDVWTELLARDDPDTALALADPGWLATLATARTATGPRVAEQLWRVAPLATLASALAVRAPGSPAAAAAAWSRVPDAVVAALPALLVAGEDIGPLAAAAPPEQTSALAAALATLRRDTIPDRALGPLRAWAHARVAERAPGYAAAFAWLAAVEADLARVARV